MSTKTTYNNLIINNVFDVCSYHGQFNLVDYYSDQFDNDIKEGYFTPLETGKDMDWELNFNEFKNNIVSVYQDLEFGNGELVIDGVDIDSPQYYNYRGDDLIVNVKMSKNFEKKLAKLCETDEFAEWLKKHYSSRDGFNSFVPNKVNEFLKSQFYLEIALEYYLVTYEAVQVEDYNQCALESFISNGFLYESINLINVKFNN